MPQQTIEKNDPFLASKLNRMFSELFANRFVIGDEDHAHVLITPRTIKVKDGATILLDISETVTIGEVAESKANIFLSGEQIDLRVHATSYMSLTSANGITIRTSALGERVEFGNRAHSIKWYDGAGVLSGQVRSGTAGIMRFEAASDIILDTTDNDSGDTIQILGENITLGGEVFGNGRKVVSMSVALAVPNANPVGGVILYVDTSGNLLCRTKNGNVRTLAAV